MSHIWRVALNRISTVVSFVKNRLVLRTIAANYRYLTKIGYTYFTCSNGHMDTNTDKQISEPAIFITVTHNHNHIHTSNIAIRLDQQLVHACRWCQYNYINFIYYESTHFARGKVQLAVWVADVKMIQESLHACMCVKDRQLV